MCGIAGYIGVSKNPKITYEIMSALLVRTESRGLDATGFWCCQKDDGETKGKISWDKKPIKATDYIKTNVWKNTKDMNPSLMIAHCRQPTKMGDEKVNKNNHPHVSDDQTIALVHNGKIAEYENLKQEYETDSGCDSEILLRMFEHSSEKAAYNFATDTEKHILDRITGIEDIFANVHYGAMAVAVGEYMTNGDRYLWLFRDGNTRPIHVIDATETLGQFFFCSTDKIWEQTSQDVSEEARKCIPESVIIFPDFQTWVLKLAGTSDLPTYERFQIKKVQSTTPAGKSKQKKEKKTGKAPTTVINDTEKTTKTPLSIIKQDKTSEVLVDEHLINSQDMIDQQNDPDEDTTLEVSTGDDTLANINKESLVESIQSIENKLEAADSIVTILAQNDEEDKYEENCSLVIDTLQDVYGDLVNLESKVQEN
jgi:hypothetical protein